MVVLCSAACVAGFYASPYNCGKSFLAEVGDIGVDAILERAAYRQRVAEHILTELELRERWARFGDPIIVGAVACGLVVSPDIDMEVYCPELRIEDGFEVLQQCAVHPNVIKARFSNKLEGPDQGLYWQLRYIHEDGEQWKVDMWSVPEDYALPRGADLVAPLRAALTDEVRTAILELKEQIVREPSLRCPSVHLYRAVLDGGVRTAIELRDWIEKNSIDALTDWRPARAKA
jgi:hypothetical protein